MPQRKPVFARKTAGRRCNLTFTVKDVGHVLPCPFCARTMGIGVEPDFDQHFELANTHTASYWIECPCGASVHGKAYGTHLASGDLTRAHHSRSKASAIAAWNRRATAKLPAEGPASQCGFH